MLVTDRRTDRQTATITVCLGSSALGIIITSFDHYNLAFNKFGVKVLEV